VGARFACAPPRRITFGLPQPALDSGYGAGTGCIPCPQQSQNALFFNEKQRAAEK